MAGTEQLTLPGTEVRWEPYRLSAATVEAGKRGVAECREVLARHATEDDITMQCIPMLGAPGIVGGWLAIG